MAMQTTELLVWKTLQMLWNQSTVLMFQFMDLLLEVTQVFFEAPLTLQDFFV